MLRPRERGEQRVAFLHQRSRGGARAFEAEPHVGRETQHACRRRRRARPPRGSRRRRTPSGPGPAVVERRRAVEVDLHLAVHAAHEPQEHVVGVVVRRRSPVGVRAVFLVVPRPDQQHVADDDPAAARPPARLQHHRPRQVTARGGHRHAVGAEPEHARVAVEDRAEHARRVEAGQAEPLDVAARGNERARRAVGQEAVLGDRREGADAHIWLSVWSQRMRWPAVPASARRARYPAARTAETVGDRGGPCECLRRRLRALRIGGVRRAVCTVAAL